MSQVQEQFKMVLIEQAATAPNKNLHLNIGWRPSMVWVINYKAAGDMAVQVDTDKWSAAADAVNGGLNFGKNAAVAAVGTDGITITDKGVTLGTDANLIREDNANLIVLCFRNLTDIGLLKVADAPTVKDSFGKGTQFDGRDSSGNLDLDSPSQFGKVSLTKSA